MKQSYLTSLALTGLFAVLLGWYLIYDKKIQPEHEKAEEKAKQLVTLEAADVQEFDLYRLKNRPLETAQKTTVSQPEYETIKLKRTGEDWNLIHPVQDKADASTVRAIVTSVTGAKQERVVEEKPKDLDPFGLSTPVVKIVLKKDEKTPTQEVDFGKNTPVGYSLYAKVFGKDPVFKISRSVISTVDKDVKALRNKEVVGIARFDVTEADIQAPKVSTVLTKNGEDNWLLARENIPADNNEWNKTLNALTDLKANDFIDKPEHLDEYGLQNPEVKVDLTKGKDKKAKVSVWIGRGKGKNKDKVYAKRTDRPTVFEVDKSILEKLETPASRYRSMKLANFNRFNVDRIKIEQGKESFELTKDKAAWMMSTDLKAKVDGGKVDTLLTKLQDGKIIKYSSSSKKLGNPSLIIHLFEKKDKAAEKEKLSLFFGSPKAGEVEVSRSDIPITFFISQDDFNKLNLGPKGYLEAPPKTGEANKNPGDKKS